MHCTSIAGVSNACALTSLRLTGKLLLIDTLASKLCFYPGGSGADTSKRMSMLSNFDGHGLRG